MIDLLIESYIAKADLWKRVYSKMKIRYFLFSFSPLFIFLYPICNQILPNKSWEYIRVLILFIPTILFGLILNYSVKKKLNISQRYVLWNSSSIQNMLKKDNKEFICQFLKEKNCYSEKKIGLLINEIESRTIENNKTVVLPFALGLMLFPLWDNYLSYLVGIYNTPDLFNSLSKYVIISVVLIIMFGLLVTVVKNAALIYYDALFNQNQKHIKKLIEILKEINVEYILEKSET